MHGGLVALQLLEFFGNLFIDRIQLAGVVQHRERFLGFADFQEHIGEVAAQGRIVFNQIDRAPQLCQRLLVTPEFE